MRNLAIFIAMIFLFSCGDQKESKKEATEREKTTAPSLTSEEAGKLLALPLECIGTEYPNKPGQVLDSDEDLAPPRKLHPAFYGCFDWHSSVHGHWSLVSLLKQFSELKKSKKAKEKLIKHLSKENIQAEVDYFKGKHAKTFERTYGWAWLLKLAEELHTWETPTGKKLEKNLQPLTDLIIKRYMKFLPKLNYPVRAGTHENTAFGLTFAYDYAQTMQIDSLKNMIAQKAKEFYMNDKNCPLSWEPSGFDFLSPCLEEVDIMRRVLTKDQFSEWLTNFLPQLSDPDFNLEPGKVSDREDGHLVHLDGLNFSRAWCFYGIAETLPQYQHLIEIANKHIQYSLPNLVGDSYEGGHWLGSFAIYALNTGEELKKNKQTG